MSLESSVIKDVFNASRLLTIIAMLPAGTTPPRLQQWWALDLLNFDAALGALFEASLLECRTTTYFVLPVIRSYLLDPSRLSADLHESMVRVACSFFKQHNSFNPGENSFKDDIEACAIEETNLQAILLETSEPNPDVIEAIYTLAWYQYHTRPRTEVIQHALKLANKLNDQKLVGYVLHCYAAILLALNRFDESLKQFTLARKAFLNASQTLLAAHMLLDIADVSAMINSSFNEIPLIEQTQQDLELIGTEHGEETQSAVQEMMVLCLRRLGTAHSRRSNHADGIKHLTKARDLCDNLPSEAAECAYHLAVAHQRLQQFDEAEKWAVLSVEEQKQFGGYLGFALGLLGMIYISKRRYDLAIEHLSEGLDCAEARGDQSDMADLLLELGRAHWKKGKSDDARAAFAQVLERYGDMEGAAVVDGKIICQYYLEKLQHPRRVPTSEERRALTLTWHEEDISFNVVTDFFRNAEMPRSPNDLRRPRRADAIWT
ncbi:hypothetical protein C8J56DRAFT_1111641 [Mycena floridula]|nr:hypothetical protein C8J56DRAFT_1111641 [Mycena floridula]